MADFGEYYTIPVILSFDGIDQQVNNGLGSKMGRAGKRAGTELSRGVVDGAKQAEAALDRAATAADKLGDKQKDAADRARLAQEKLNEAQEKGISGSRLTAAQNARDKALRQELAVTRDLERANADLERAKKQAADAGESSGGDGGESAGGAFLEGFSGAIAAIGTKAGPIGVALTAAAGVALAGGGIIAQQVMAGMEREADADRIQAQLGLSDVDAAQFGRSAGEVYGSNFGESLGDVNDAMAAVSSTLGQSSGAALEDITAKALTFRDVFGTDVASSIAFAQNLIVNGLAPDAVSAFDMMTTAYQRVPTAMRDELPEILAEYSTYFESLGFSGAEAFGLLVNTAPQGKIALDKLGDSLKEFTLLATDLGAKPVQDALSGMGLDGQNVANNLLAGGDTAQQQFDGIIDKLLAIQDPAEQAGAAIALFGTPLEDLDKAKIPEFLSSLDNADQAMAGFAGSAEQMVDTMGSNSAASVETAMRAIETAKADMQSGLAEAFGPQIEQFSTWVSEHGPEITDFFATFGEFAAAAGQQVLLFVADATGALADLVNVVGDVHGGLLRFGANVQELLGNDERAAQWREEAEAAFGLADSLYETEEGARSAAGAMGDAAESFGQTQAQAQLVGDNVDRISQIMGQLPNGKQIDISAIVTYQDQNGLVIPPDQLRAPVRVGAVPGETVNRAGRAFGGEITGPGGPTSDVIPIWASNGEHMLPANEVDMLGGQAGVYGLRQWIRAGAFGKYAQGGALGDAGGLRPFTQQLRSLVTQTFGITDIGGYRGQDGYNEHSSGRALDVMIPDWESAEGIALGNSVAQWALSIPGVNRVMWQQSLINSDGSSTPVPDRGSPTQNHMDHVHIFTDDMPVGSVPSAPMSFGSGGGAGGYGSSGGGGGGGGTAGYGPNGEAGTYSVDPTDVRDAEGRVREADARVREAEAKQRELEADAKESQKISAQNDVDKAKTDAEEARRGLAEAQQGKFTATKDSPSGSGGQGGMGQFGELGSIAGSFLKETFGIDGSWLPDMSSLFPVQAAETLLSSFLPLAFGGAGGGDAGAATSSSPFGIPDISAPPMPAPGVHPGSGGLPGPGGGPVSIDASTQIHGNVGWSADEIEHRRRQNESRGVARIPVGQ